MPVFIFPSMDTVRTVDVPTYGHEILPALMAEELVVVAVDDPESAISARLADLLFTGIDVMPAPLSFVVGDA